MHGRSRRKRGQLSGLKSPLLLAFLASTPTSVSAQSCISLAGSTQCVAFNTSSISTSPELSGQLYVSSGFTR